MQTSTGRLDAPAIDFEAHAFVPAERCYAESGKIALKLSTMMVCELSVTASEWEAFEIASIFMTLSDELFVF